jgi:hypothetical protein
MCPRPAECFCKTGSHVQWATDDAGCPVCMCQSLAPKSTPCPVPKVPLCNTGFEITHSQTKNGCIKYTCKKLTQRRALISDVTVVITPAASSSASPLPSSSSSSSSSSTTSSTEPADDQQQDNNLMEFMTDFMLTCPPTRACECFRPLQPSWAIDDDGCPHCVCDNRPVRRR